MSDDVLAEFEPFITAAEQRDADAVADDPNASPWTREPDTDPRYRPNLPLLVTLLMGPIAEEAASQSGRLAKAFDAWVAYELRRARFHPSEVWPRNSTPRVSSREVETLEEKVRQLAAWVKARDADADRRIKRLERSGDPEALAQAAKRLDQENTRRRRAYERRVKSHAARTAKAERAGREPPDPLPPLELRDRVPVRHELMTGLRTTIQGVVNAMPNVNATNVLGRFYVKQVDVVVSSWDRGPDVLVSGKTMFSSFAKNTKNRYEETLGEASNLRDRYPLASMGYAFLVSDDIFDEAGAYARLQDLLLRTRKPHGPYDATMLLIATWDPASRELRVADPLTHHNPEVASQKPPVDLSAGTFFTDLLNAAIVNTPVGIHQEVRELRNGAPTPGGAPDLQADAADDESAHSDAGDERDDADEDAILSAEVHLDE